jgi:putative hydrolase of the HAD superfamily
MNYTSFIKTAFFDLGGTLIGSNRDWQPGAQATLDKLRARHIRLGIISNTAAWSRAQILELLPADFDLGMFENSLVIFSSEVHLEKPDPAIFRLAIQRSHLMAADCLFCTEESSHTPIAQQLGMKVVNLRRPPNSDIGKLVKTLVNRRLLPA